MKLKSIFITCALIFSLVNSDCQVSDITVEAGVKYFDLTTLTLDDPYIDLMLLDSSHNQFYIAYSSGSNHTVIWSNDSDEAQRWTVTYANTALIPKSGSLSSDESKLWFSSINTGSGNMVVLCLDSTDGSQIKTLEYVIDSTVSNLDIQVGWVYNPDGFFFTAQLNSGANIALCKTELASATDITCFDNGVYDTNLGSIQTILPRSQDLCMAIGFDLGFGSMDLYSYDFSVPETDAGFYGSSDLNEDLDLTSDSSLEKGILISLSTDDYTMSLITFYISDINLFEHLKKLTFDSTHISTSMKIRQVEFENGIVHLLLSETDNLVVKYDTNTEEASGFFHDSSSTINILHGYTYVPNNGFTYLVGGDFVDDNFVFYNADFNNLDKQSGYWEDITSSITVLAHTYSPSGYTPSLTSMTMTHSTANTFTQVSDTLVSDPDSKDDVSIMYVHPSSSVSFEFEVNSALNTIEPKYTCFTDQTIDDSAVFTLEDGDDAKPNWIAVNTDSGQIVVVNPPELGSWNFIFKVVFEENGYEVIQDITVIIVNPEDDDDDGYCGLHFTKSQCVGLILGTICGVIVLSVIVIAVVSYSMLHNPNSTKPKSGQNYAKDMEKVPNNEENKALETERQMEGTPTSTKNNNYMMT